MRNCLATTAILLAILAAAGCGQAPVPAGTQHARPESGSRPEAADPTAPIAVANPYLAAALGDLLGRRDGLLVLAEPGMCPGHFDLRPSQVRRLHRCRLLVRFDFQRSLDARLGDDPARTPRVVAVTVPGGMCEPQTYRAVCRQLAEALVHQQRLSPEQSQRRTAAVDRRMDQLSRWATDRIDAAGLRGAPVLASTHQAAFCRRLGLDVVDTFSAVDTAQPGQINRAIRAGQQARVRLIVANRPEGRQLADALADRLAAKVVIFDNFPNAQEPQPFDDLVHRNLASLAQAAKP